MVKDHYANLGFTLMETHRDDTVRYLRRDDLTLKPETSVNDFEEWDSFKHIEIIYSYSLRMLCMLPLGDGQRV